MTFHTVFIFRVNFRGKECKRKNKVHWYRSGLSGMCTIPGYS